MSTIRPQYPPAAPPQVQAHVQAQGGQRLQGQDALFALARSKTAEGASAPAAEPQPAAVNRLAETRAESPQKILRPGSLLDIRI